MRYKKGDLPASVDSLLDFLENELLKIERAQGTTQPNYVFDTLYAEPVKLIEGMMVKADGTVWNPGSGAGFYGYRAGAWRFLG